ncbi:MAG: DUF2029 domain-containing protein [Alphaproteobacteria bacterium]|nr:DUF2029 domain-containing protein [Alphaproteobacteria bacterium]
MAASSRPPVLSLLAELPGLLALAVLGLLFGQGVAARVTYPFDLEWMEGGMLMHAWRVAQGLPIYTEPSADWVPYIYPPLYPWLVAAVGLVTGVDYAPARLLSVVGVVAACLALIWGLRREGGGGLIGLAAAALFLSTWDDSGWFMDLVRTDGLLVGLLGWSLVLTRSGRVVPGGLLLVLAFMAKHNAAVFGLPCIVWLALTQGRRAALRYGAASVVPALLFTGAMQLTTGGHFLRYLLGMPAHHGFVLERFFPGTPQELQAALPVVLPLVAAGAVALAVRGLRERQGAAAVAEDRRDWREGVAFWAANIVLAVVFGMVMRGHTGGYLNVLMPAHWALCLAAGLGAIALRRAWRHPVMVLATAAVLGFAAWQARFDVAPELPTAEDRAAGEQLIETIAAIDGEVFMPHAPWYPVKAGKQGGPHLIALWDIDNDGGYHQGIDAVAAAMADQRWAAVFTADKKLGYGLLDHYEATGTVRYSGRAFLPKTGWQVRPRTIYTPRGRPAE